MVLMKFYKLQKQVDFLEENKTCSAVFHNYNILNENKLIPFKHQKLIKDYVFNIDAILDDWFIQTATLVFRKSVLDSNKRISDLHSFDRTLVYDCALNGNIGFINNYMSVYRVHANGITKSRNQKLIYENNILKSII